MIGIFRPGRRARHAVDTRPTVAEIEARIDAEYAHAVGPDEYPTAKLPAYTAAMIRTRALAVDPEDEMRFTPADLGAGAIDPDGTPVRPRPRHELDAAIGGAR
ncbi:hypothetical protein ACFYTF_29120 [Nocardia thailandica]|uniref:Uncharacterized protein n=1 Tax=Nocardia thailandica TaxID=257275 RepID=A0ABW6PWU5_9NOCA